MKNSFIVFYLLFLIIGCNQSDKMNSLNIYEKKGDGFVMFYKISSQQTVFNVYNTRLKVSCDSTTIKEIILSVGVNWDKIKEFQEKYDLFPEIELPPKKDKVYNEVRLELKGKPMICKLLSEEYQKTGQNPTQLILKENTTIWEYITLNSYELTDWSVKTIEIW